MKSYNDISLLNHARTLYPFCRSLTGHGTRQTLEYFERFHPEYKRLKFASGTKVFDWNVPLEWNIVDCFLEHIATGTKYACFKDHNLHIVGYSTPIDQIMDLADLLPRIHTIEDHPTWIPYVTSYYEPYWGFCMSENTKNSLMKGKYRVLINSSLTRGFLDMSHATINGRFRNEIFFTSYICHPSLANNEISGPVVLNALMDYIKFKYPRPNYTYRFLLAPETIGAICYLDKYLSKLKRNMICGFNLSCVGDDRAFSYIQTPTNDTLADSVIRAALIGKNNVKPYTFLERGSDERQYCSPGIDLPLCTFSRSRFGTYPEYHSSADDMSVISESGLTGSLNVLKTIVDAFELSLVPRNLIKCEPQLGKRNLYPSRPVAVGAVHPSKAIKDILVYSNSKNTIFDIANITSLPLDYVVNEVSRLISLNILKPLK